MKRKYFFFAFVFLTGLSTVIVLRMRDQKPMSPASPPVHAMTVTPRLGDRFFIESILMDIFGPEAAEITKKFIFERATIWGGPCDSYEQVRINAGPDGLTDPHSACPNGKGAASLPMVATPNLLRQAYMRRACSALINSTSTMNIALSKIFPKGKTEKPEAKSLVAAYHLFHPALDPDSKILDALEQTAKKENDTLKQWSDIYFILCTDPKWQLI